ncbi:MAG: YhjD/YihY/BrkB family envelope integrity protein, partial [Aquificaceae bacterium]
YYFSMSFARSLNTAFGFACGKKPVEREWLFITFMPLLLILYVFILSLALALLTVSKILLGGMYHRLTDVLNLLLLFLIIKMLYASYFKPRREVFIASAFVALMFFLLNKVFSLIVAKLVSLSPIYSVLGSPLLFLVWLYYSFYCLLVGARLITTLDKV